LVTLGIRIKLLLPDRGFYSVRVIRDLITCALPFTMPAVKRGKKPTTAGGPTGTYALAAEKQSQWTPYTLNSAKESQVAFDLAVICHNTRGQRGRHQREALLYATWGLTHRPLTGFGPRIAVVLALSRLTGNASGSHPHQQPQTGLASVVHGRSVGVAQYLGLVACRSDGPAQAWRQATSAAIAALCPFAVVVVDGSCQTLSALKKNPCLS
jgi:hypothetical protein